MRKALDAIPGIQRSSLAHTSEQSPLLQIPLFLALYIALGAPDDAHSIVSHFLAALCGQNAETLKTVADMVFWMEFAGDRTRSFLDSRLKGTNMCFADLSPLVEVHGTVHALHDVLWDWLAGLGALHYLHRSTTRRDVLRIRNLRARLALIPSTIGKVDEATVGDLLNTDIVASASLLRFITKGHSRDALALKILENAKLHSCQQSPTIVERGVLATLIVALEGYSIDMETLLISVGAAQECGYRISEFEEVLTPSLLWNARHQVENALEANILRERIVLFICSHGNPAWDVWARMCRTGVLADWEAITISICTTGQIPHMSPSSLNAYMPHAFTLFRALRTRGLYGALTQSLFEMILTWLDSPQARKFLAQGLSCRWMFEAMEYFKAADTQLSIAGYEAVLRSAARARTWGGEIARVLPRSTKIEFILTLHAEVAPFASWVDEEDFVRTIPCDAARALIGSADWRWQKIGWQALAFSNCITADDALNALPATLDGVETAPSLYALAELDHLDQSAQEEILRLIMLGGTFLPDVSHALIRLSQKLDLGPRIIWQTSRGCLPANLFGMFADALLKWERLTGTQVLIQAPDGQMPLIDYAAIQLVESEISTEGARFLGAAIAKSGSELGKQALLNSWFTSEPRSHQLAEQLARTGLPRDLSSVQVRTYILSEDTYTVARALMDWDGVLTDDILVLAFERAVHQDEFSAEGQKIQTRLFVRTMCPNTNSSHQLFHERVISWLAGHENLDLVSEIARGLVRYTRGQLRAMIEPWLHQSERAVWWLVRELESLLLMRIVDDRGSWIPD